MYWYLGQKTPENRVIEKKLMFLFHLANLPVDALARKVYEEERRLDVGDIGGLVSECRRHFAELNIREGLLTSVSKSQWRQIVGEKLGLKKK